MTACLAVATCVLPSKHPLLVCTVKKYSEWIDGSKQRDAFLIEGQQKYFTCSSFGNPTDLANVRVSKIDALFVAIAHLSDYKWFMNESGIPEVYFGVREDCHTLNIGANQNCSDIDVFQYSSLENEGKLYYFSHNIIM